MSLLEMKNISKEFPGVKALDNVSLTVRRRTVHSLMGENGAGKSTFLKVLSGEIEPSKGDVSLEKVERISVLKLDNFDFEDDFD